MPALGSEFHQPRFPKSGEQTLTIHLAGTKSVPVEKPEAYQAQGIQIPSISDTSAVGALSANIWTLFGVSYNGLKSEFTAEIAGDRRVKARKIWHKRDVVDGCKVGWHLTSSGVMGSMHQNHLAALRLHGGAQ